MSSVFGHVAVLACLVLACSSMAAFGVVPAFPGAEGYGAYVVGGRNGDVYHVTSLEDSGPGSLRYGLNNAPEVGRTIVFDVSGLIPLKSTLKISKPHITIAGQSAPGDGICVKNEEFGIRADDVIMRYIRSRVGDKGTSDCDAAGTRNHANLIVDHCSFSWAIDEVASFYRNKNITVQWSILSEALHQAHHAKGGHGYAGGWGGDGATYHHNLIASCASRNPRMAGKSQRDIDFRNCVVYNWGFNSCYGGEDNTVNFINNYYKPGPGTRENVRTRLANPIPETEKGLGWTAKWYFAGNVMLGSKEVTENNWKGVQPSDNLKVAPRDDQELLKKIRADKPFPVAPVATQTAERAYELVLTNAGASLHRDVVDRRVIDEVRTGTAHFGGKWGPATGIIDSQEQAGGWPEYKSVPKPVDTDNDGMPDEWEKAHGLNPNVDDHRGDYNGDGYTNLEKYLNGLVAAPGQSAPAGSPATLTTVK